MIETRSTSRPIRGRRGLCRSVLSGAAGSREGSNPKNLYKKARAGQIREFTGIDAPHGVPEDPEIVVHTEKQIVDESVATVLEQFLLFLRD